MTDEQIIKALPTVAYGGHSCNKCKYKYEKGECRCGLKGCRITRNALDLINRLQAEIERLTTMNSELNIGIKKLKEFAIKEFAERLKEIYVVHEGLQIEIDNLVKEMTEPVKIEHNSLCETETYMGE